MLSLAETLPPDLVTICLVAANQPCDGLGLAADHGLSTRLVDRKTFRDKNSHERALGDAIEECGADWICLAGYMAILSPAFVKRFQNRIVNIHPSLLPAFKGLETHQRALDAGATRHGATVHLVTPELDDGPILLQAGLDIHAGEDAGHLAARVLNLEHALYPFVMMSIANGDLALSGETVVWHDRQAALARAGAHVVHTLQPTVFWP